MLYLALDGNFDSVEVSYGKEVTLSVRNISELMASDMLEDASGFRSAVPYDDVAKLLSVRLGVKVVPSVARVTLSVGDTLILAYVSRSHLPYEVLRSNRLMQRVPTAYRQVTVISSTNVW